jgi:hypothetical protein
MAWKFGFGMSDMYSGYTGSVRYRTALLTLAALTAGLAGCGSSSGSSPTATATTNSFAYNPAHAHVPPCAHAGAPIALFGNFPKSFPFPPGTSITGHRVPIGGGIAEIGFIPAATFTAGVKFFPNELPHAGYKVLHVEIDAPHDSEGSYQGHGYLGGWSLRSISGCKGVLAMQASAIPQKH